MAQEILISIEVRSQKANQSLKNVSKTTDEYKGKVDALTRAQNSYKQALDPVNVGIEKLKMLTAQATKATKEKAAADLMAEGKIKGLTKSQQNLSKEQKLLIKLENDLKKAMSPVNKEIQLRKLKIKEANAAAIEAAKISRDVENGVTQEKTANELLSGSLDKLTAKQRENLIESRKQELQLKLNKQQIDLEARAALGDAEALKILELQKKKTASATGQMRAQSGLNNAILLETGRLASDASFGFTAIANNLSQLISLFQSYSRTAGGTIASFKALGRSLLGTGGLLIAVQLLISFLPKIIKSFTETADAVKKFNEEVKNATESIDEQINTFNRLNKNVEKYGDIGKFAGQSIKVLRDEFTELDAALTKLDENQGVLITERFGEEETLQGANAINRLKKAFIELLEVRREEASLETQLFAKNEKTGEFIIKSETARLNLQSRLSFALEKRLRLEKELKQETIDFSPIDVDLTLEDRDISLADLFTDPADDDKLQGLLDEMPEYIDNADEVIDEYVMRKGKDSLLSRIFKLEPNSREKDLQALKDATNKFGDEALFATDEYRRATQAINDKWDEIERKQRMEHLQFLIGNLSNFFSEAAQLNQKNKDLARLSVITNSAAASIGIWQSYFDIKNQEKGTLALAGTIAAQAALLASTQNALKSINSEKVGGQITRVSLSKAPEFNVVGASGQNQLQEQISEQLGNLINVLPENGKLEAFVRYPELENAGNTVDQINRNASFGN